MVRYDPNWHDAALDMDEERTVKAAHDALDDHVNLFEAFQGGLIPGASNGFPK